MILVTGGTGLVGAHLLFRLIKNGESVRAIYRNKQKLKNVKSVFGSYEGNHDSLFDTIEWLQGDLLDIPSLSEAFKDVKTVYHCAAFVSFEPDKYHVLRRTNIEGTANIVNTCIAKNIEKLCYVSSIATLGTSLKNEPISEDTYWNPEEDNNVYAITKYGAEMEVWRSTQEGLKTVIVNPGVILGAGIWHYGTGSLFKRAHKGMRYYSSGSVGLVAIEDVVTIMIKLMHSNIHNERFILVAENWSHKMFLQSLSKAVHSKLPEKLASGFMLGVAWRMDWLKHKLIGKRRQLTKHIAKSLQTKKHYSSQKIENALGYKFQPIDKTISVLGAQYLK